MLDWHKILGSDIDIFLLIESWWHLLDITMKYYLLRFWGWASKLRHSLAPPLPRVHCGRHLAARHLVQLPVTPLSGHPAQHGDVGVEPPARLNILLKEALWCEKWEFWAENSWENCQYKFLTEKCPKVLFSAIFLSKSPSSSSFSGRTLSPPPGDRDVVEELPGDHQEDHPARTQQPRPRAPAPDW